jgi:hypothetical protein
MTSKNKLKLELNIRDGAGWIEPGKKTIKNIATLEDCQRAYIEIRDSLDIGASHLSEGHVYDQDNKHIARISYNGRLWNTKTWEPGDEPIIEAPKI